MNALGKQVSPCYIGPNVSKQTMNKHLLAALLLFLSNLVFSQNDFRQGFIIKNIQDTSWGFVNYRENGRAHKVCNFKSSTEGAAITYHPADISGYGYVNDRFFESGIIQEDDQTSDSVFLEVLVKGPVTLYKVNASFWVKKEGQEQPYYELTNETKDTYVNGGWVRKNTNLHISTLSMLLFDCAEIRSSISSVHLTERSLTNLIEKYNRCMGVDVKPFKDKKSWTKVSVGIAAGINFSKLTVDASNNLSAYLAGPFEISPAPMAGLTLDISSPRLSERFSFKANIFYLNSKYRHDNTSHSDIASITQRDYVTIKLQQLKIPLGIQYTFPERKFTPFINAGVSNTLHLSSSSTWEQEVTSDTDVSMYEKEPIHIKDNAFGFWGSVGVLRPVSNRFDASLEMRGEQTNGITKGAQSMTSNLTNFQIILTISTK